MNYEYLNIGDKIQKSDEYTTSPNEWKLVPDFMVGDIIGKSSTKWRRATKKNEKENPKKTKKA